MKISKQPFKLAHVKNLLEDMMPQGIFYRLFVLILPIHSIYFMIQFSSPIFLKDIEIFILGDQPSLKKYTF